MLNLQVCTNLGYCFIWIVTDRWNGLVERVLVDKLIIIKRSISIFAPSLSRSICTCENKAAEFIETDLAACSIQCSFRSRRPHFAGGIWKSSFFSTVRPTFHTKPSPKRSFSKTLFNPEEFENRPALRFSVDGKHFENGAFRKWWRYYNHVISLTGFSSNTNPKWPVAFSNFDGVSSTENISNVVRVNPPFSNSSRVVWRGLRNLPYGRVSLLRKDEDFCTNQWLKIYMITEYNFKIINDIAYIHFTYIDFICYQIKITIVTCPRIAELI